METATKKPGAATRKRQDAIRRLRLAGLKESTLSELAETRSLNEEERTELELARQEVAILRAQLSYRGGHAFLGVSDMEYADRHVEHYEHSARSTKEIL